MNYSKSGVIARRHQLNSYGGKIVRKLILLVIKVVIAAVIGVGVCLAAGGIGLFKSVLAGNARDPYFPTSSLTVRLLSCMMRWAMSSTIM